MATKSNLRKQFLAERKALPAEEVERRSLAIAERFLPAFHVIHTFLPIVQQNEVNTWLIIRRIWHEFPQISIAVSVTIPVNQSLTHYELTPETQLIENRWGIPEPATSDQRPVTVRRFGSEQLDVVLVPLLAFDLRGHRVGYGGGYYDRFLAECRPDCLKIGLSLFEPVEWIEGIEATDVPLDGCMTSRNFHWFSNL